MARSIAALPQRGGVQWYGYKRDGLDPRDHSFVASDASLPDKIDLRTSGFMPAVYDQGALGSCTANAIASAVCFCMSKQGKQAYTPSRLFIYYGERAIEGTTRTDSGAEIRDGIKVVAKLGAPNETLWPYSIGRYRSKPSPAVFKAALLEQAVKYEKISAGKLSDMKACLASGFPFVFGFTVPDTFEGDDIARTGIMPMPTKDTKYVGGHAVKAVGYDDHTQMVCVKNSWADDWGDKGFFYMPYAFISNARMANDMWKISLVE